MFVSRYADFGSFSSQSPNIYTNHFHYFKFSNVAWAYSTRLKFVFSKYLTWSIQAQTIFSFTWSRIVLLTNFKKSRYFSHAFLKSKTKSTYHSYKEESVITFQTSIILYSITLSLTIFSSSPFIFGHFIVLKSNSHILCDMFPIK